MLDREADTLPLTTQAALLSLNRSSLYYRPVGPDAEEIALKHRIDEIYTDRPFYGSRRMTAQLNQEGYAVNRKRVQRFMREMGIWGIAPGPQTSTRHPQHPVYPYLLNGVTPAYPNHVWGIDITYIRLVQGGGLPISGAHAVQVTQYSDPQGETTPYGQVVTAQLHWAVPISVVHLQLPTSVPLTSTVEQPSQYVAFGSNTAQSNSQCTTPTLSLATASTISTCSTATIYVTKDIPATTSCQPQTTAVCSPSTQKTWVTSSTEQCGYTTQDEYTCHPVQRCTPVTSEVCTPIWGEQCGSWSGGTYTPWGYCITTHSDSCTTQTSESCSTTDVCGYSPVTTYSCHPVTTGHWQTTTTESCHDVTTTACTTVPAHTEQVPETVQQCS
ncbi:HTH-like domain-containing protein [Sulfobacillus thermosulfidooxidans DSM 9293]|uniref:HTH-like domain-containing protein n=1 Tax=Sulfobacillus thermosulfidooxidans (strain DSM 9293 / VKM B-1269 / AT-1) TaxID=929705 RepID=A0A1W1WPP2_SULTA|nr:HTH-like domain-containing protein [Sulfobacillus thermosulfidooxidans DSM 9293]